jgi:hypothetical protein
LTWHCVPCHAREVGESDHNRVAEVMGVFSQVER